MDTQRQPPRSDSIWSVVAQLRSERRRLIAMRLSTVGLFATWLVAVLWSIPIVPFGVQQGEFTTNTLVALVLVNASYVVLFGWFGRWGSLFSRESAPEFVRVLFGAKLLIRGRAQFMSRLAAECASRRGFSLILLRLPKGGANGSLGPDTAIVRARALIRSDDVFGEIGASELGVISRGTAGEAMQGMLARLQTQLAASSTFLQASIGASTYPDDGEDGEQLLAIARERLASVGPFAAAARAARQPIVVENLLAGAAIPRAAISTPAGEHKAPALEQVAALQEPEPPPLEPEALMQEMPTTTEVQPAALKAMPALPAAGDAGELPEFLVRQLAAFHEATPDDVQPDAELPLDVEPDQIAEYWNLMEAGGPASETRAA